MYLSNLERTCLYVSELMHNYTMGSEWSVRKYDFHLTIWISSNSTVSKNMGIIRLFGEFNSIKIDRSIYENPFKINHWKCEKLIYWMQFNTDREIMKKINFKRIRYKVESILIQLNLSIFKHIYFTYSKKVSNLSQNLSKKIWVTLINKGDELWLKISRKRYV